MKELLQSIDNAIQKAKAAINGGGSQCQSTSKVKATSGETMVKSTQAQELKPKQQSKAEPPTPTATKVAVTKPKARAKRAKN